MGEKTGGEKTGGEKTGGEKTGGEKTGRDRTGRDRTGVNWGGPQAASRLRVIGYALMGVAIAAFLYLVLSG